MKCVKICTILLKSNMVHIKNTKSGLKKIINYGSISVFIGSNSWAALIFKEILAKDTFAPQSAPNSHSHVIHWLF